MEFATWTLGAPEEITAELAECAEHAGKSTITIIPLALLIYDLPLGYYLGLFTSAVIGALQGVAHAVGYARSGTVRGSLGAGFYTAVPLSITGVVVFVQLVLALPG